MMTEETAHEAFLDMNTMSIPEQVLYLVGKINSSRIVDVQSVNDVDIGFETDFLKEDEASEMFFKSGKTGKLHFDLPGYIAFRLGRAGLSSIHISGIDTYVEEENYFSYRRSCHKGENGYGRQISTIVISTDSND